MIILTKDRNVYFGVWNSPTNSLNLNVPAVAALLNTPLCHFTFNSITFFFISPAFLPICHLHILYIETWPEQTRGQFLHHTAVDKFLPIL